MKNEAVGAVDVKRIIRRLDSDLVLLSDLAPGTQQIKVSRLSTIVDTQIHLYLYQYLHNISEVLGLPGFLDN